MKSRIKSALAFGLSGLEVLLAACSGGTATPVTTPTATPVTTPAPDCEKVFSSRNVDDQIVVQPFYYANPPEFAPNFGIYSKPAVEERTVTADIRLTVSDKNRDLNEIILYEDGKKIQSLSGKELANPRYTYQGTHTFTVEHQFTVEHHTPGSHVYFGEAVDACGSMARSKELVLTFKGSPIDKPPRLYTLYVDSAANLIVSASDSEGDNRGIKNAILYRNGVVVAKFDGGGKTVWGDRFKLPQTVGKSEYVLEVHDLGDNVEMSRVFVDFQR